MKKILGLDLGTTSIGWAVVNQAEKSEEKSSIVRLGVRVNPLSTDERTDFEKGKPATSDRTLKRGMRRNLKRYQQRRNYLISVLKEHGFISDGTILSEQGPGSTFSTLRLRAKAAKEEITLEEFARVLLMINKKRGYKSNRKAQNEEEGELIDGMEVARKLYDEHMTPGEYASMLLDGGKKFVPQFYGSDLQAEFDVIWDYQRGFYTEELTEELRETLRGKGRRETVNNLKNVLKAEEYEVKDRKIRLKEYYRLRARALRERIEPEQLITVFAEINKEISSASGYLGKISDHSKELYFKKMTVGEYLMNELDKDPHYRLKNKVFYRTDYLNEFNVIWEKQAEYHKELTPDLKQKIRDVVIFYQRRLKSQKGLISHCEFESKEIEVMVDGKPKKVVTGPRVCPKSSPLFQKCKILQDLNNLVIEDKKGKNGRSLTDAERDVLARKLEYSRKMTMAELLQAIGLNTRQYGLNYREVQGNVTQMALLDACKKIVEMTGHDVDNFDKMSADDRMNLVKNVFEQSLKVSTDFLAFNEGTNSDEMQRNPMFKLWHLLYSYEDDKTPTGNGKLVEHIAELTGLDKEYAMVLANVKFVQDYGSLSTKALLKILPHLKQGWKYSEACERAGYRHSAQSLTAEEIANKQLLDRLEILPKNTLRNPVVEKILNQMIHVVNACMAEYGRFDEIHVEMARELKENAAKRQDTTEYLNKRARELEEIRRILKTEFGLPTVGRNDVIRYQLWKELEPRVYHTLYTDTYIPKDELFSRKFDIEHIIPQARRFDDSLSNKTLETREANIEKGNMTAIDYVAWKAGEAGKEEYLKRISYLNKRETQKKYKNLTTSLDDVEDGFLNRDLTDSQYIAKKAKEILSEVTRTVIPTIGSITARLRDDWQLVDVMKELNWDKYEKLGLTETVRRDDGHEVRKIQDWTKRNDHRHHAMDALTIAFTRLNHINLLNNLNASMHDEQNDNRWALERKEITKGGKFVPPMELDEFRAEAKRHLENILVSIKAKNKVVTPRKNKCKGAKTAQHTLTPRGQLHNETVYGKRWRYATKEEKVGSTFTAEKIATVCKKDYRDALMARLTEFGGDAKKAFTGKNSLEKNPVWLNAGRTNAVPLRVKTVVLESYFTIRKDVAPDLKVDKVVDAHIREILNKRVAEYGEKNAFLNLDENPIWLNKEKGIAIKRVTITGVNVATPLHVSHDKDGNVIMDGNGEPIPTDYVSTSNNHHIAIFEDKDGNWQEHVVSLLEATAAAAQGLPIVDVNYNSEIGWKFLFTMKQNEYFVFPDEASGFDPNEVDLMNPDNYAEISKHLYRVQKLAKRNYVFRHHLETNVAEDKTLKGITWKIIQSTNNLKGVVKVRVNHIGRIVAVGEYK